MTRGAGTPEWTLSVFHNDAALRRYLDVFETFACEVTGLSRFTP
jgi:hypothetical protein